jgi:hypothetical protein
VESPVSPSPHFILIAKWADPQNAPGLHCQSRQSHSKNRKTARTHSFKLSVFFSEMLQINIGLTSCFVLLLQKQIENSHFCPHQKISMSLRMNVYILTMFDCGVKFEQ